MSGAGILLATMAMLGYGIGNGLTKIPINKYSHQRVILYREIFACIIIFIALLFFLKSSHYNLLFISLTFLLSIIGYIGLAFFYKALKFGSIGIISPVANSSSLITILLALTFLSEKLNFPQTVAIISIIFGVILISVNFKLFKESDIFNIKSGIPYALLACIIWGIYFFLLKYIVAELGPILTCFIIELGTLISCIVEIKLQKINKEEIQPKDLKVVFAIAALSSLAAISYNIGIQSNNVSLMSAITSSSPLIAIIFGKLVYKDKLKLSQYLAVLLILLGIISLSYF